MELLNIKSPNFLGGQNVHSLLKLALAGFIVYKLVKQFNPSKTINMSDLLNIKSPNFLGGQNVHNVLIIGLLAFAAYKLK